MAYENKCMYCFEDLNGQHVCPHCGRDARAAVPQIQLLPGTLLYHDRFLVGRAMGQDASGIVYMAYDTKRETTLRIREYLPRDCARRLNDGSVVPVAGEEEAFERGMQRLKASVEAVEDPKKRHFYFEENGTAYIAQRKSASRAAAQAEEEREGRSTRQWALIIGGAAVGVLVIAFLLIRLLSGVFDAPQDVVPNPTLASDALWEPEETPSPTPHVQTTYAPITDPELSWMDYVYGGDANQEYNNQAGSVRTPTPAPNATPRPTSQIINGNSSTEEITSLQWQLIALGWLDATQPTGVYDSATRQAVRDFQTYMNSTYAIDPKLTVDGIAGPVTLYWLDQASIAARPTQSPATLPPIVTQAPDSSPVINEDSSASEVRRVQQLLITLGQLPAGSADGIYGSATRGAVWEFQSFVNRYYGYQVLEVTGEVDASTYNYMVIIADWWQNMQTPTPAPTTAAPTTPAPTTVAPTTAAPTTAAPESGISANSPAERIRYMQTMLRDLGFLNGVDGVYGSATSIAVRNFQVWVNQQLGYNVLSVTGNCDENTLRYLEYYIDNPVTPAPTTAAPTQPPITEPPITQPPATEDPGAGDEDDVVIVGPDSDPSSIRYMQEMLVALGYLDEADGIYGSATTQAIINFQRQVNADLGYEAITPNGVFNGRTQGYLEDYYSNASLNPTDAPTTEAPTQPPAAQVGEPQISFEGASGASEGITRVQNDFTISWAASGDVGSYRVTISDESGAVIYDQTGAAPQGGTASLGVDIDQLTTNVVYELSVTAIPANGSESDGVTALTWFMRVGGSATEAPAASAPQISANTGSENGVYVFDGDVSFSWSAENAAGYYLTLTDAQGNPVREGNYQDTTLTLSAADFTPGEVYTLEVAALAADGNGVSSTVLFMVAAPQATETPTPPPVSTPQISANTGSENGVYVFDGDVSFSWSAENAVGYYLIIRNAQGDTVNEGNFDSTSFTLPAANFTPGEVYTLEVSALAADGNGVSNTAQFMIAAPQATETPTPPPVSTPQISANTGSENGVYVFDGDVSFSWSAENAVGYYLIIRNAQGDTVNEGNFDSTSFTLPAANFTPGEVYTLEVSALAADGNGVSNTAQFMIAAPQATETPETPTSIDQYSPPEDIYNMQLALNQLGLFSQSGTPQQGVFDQITREAVLLFQQQYNATNPDVPLVEIDPADVNAVVDQATLTLLMSAAQPVG